MSKKNGEEVTYMGAKTENKPQVVGTQLEPYHYLSSYTCAFDVSRFYQQIAGMVKLLMSP